MRLLRPSGIGDCGNHLPAHPHVVAQMVPGGVVDGAGQARGLGLLLSRELGLRYETAWLMAHKLRHALTERPEFPLEGFGRGR